LAFNKEKVMDAARKFVEKNQLDKAVKEYLRVVQEDPKDVRVWLKIGDLYAKKGSKHDATETYLRVARFYQDQGFYLKAVAVYKQILKLDPRLVDVSLKLAELYRQLGLMSDAMQHFEQVAGHFHREGNTKDALATVRQLVELDQENIATRIKLAELYSKEGLVEEACKEFIVACDQLRRQNRQDDFLKVAERLLWHKPENIQLNRELASLYLRRNDPRRALQKLQVCFKADPRDVETLGLLAQAFQGLDQKAKTVSVLKELARIHVENRNRASAESVYRKILLFVPNDPDAVQYLGDKASRSKPARLSTPIPAVVMTPTPDPKFSITGEMPAVPGNVRMTGAVPLIDEASLDADFALPEDEEVGGDFSADMAQEGSYRHSSLAGEQHAEEIAKILAETDVYVKYGLHQKAIDHLRRVFALDEENLEARERLKDILIAQGREREALAELVRMAEICAPSDPERAAVYVREVLAIDGSNRPAMDLARRFRLDLTAAPQMEVLSEEDDNGAVAPVDEELDFDSIDFDDSPQSRGGGGGRAAVAVATGADRGRRDSIDDFDPHELIAGKAPLAHGSPTPTSLPAAPPRTAPTTTKRDAVFQPIPHDGDLELEFDQLASETRQVSPDQIAALANQADDDLDLEAPLGHPVTSDDMPMYRGEPRGQWSSPQPQASRAQHEQAASWQQGQPWRRSDPSLDAAVAAQLDEDEQELSVSEAVQYDDVIDEDIPFDPHAAREFDAQAQLRPPSSQGYEDHDPVAAYYGEGVPMPGTATAFDQYPAFESGAADDSGVNATVDDDGGYRRAGDEHLVRSQPAAYVDPAAGGASLEDELDEADFYLSQGMAAEAAEILRNLAARYGNHPLVVTKLRDAEASLGAETAASETTFGDEHDHDAHAHFIQVEHDQPDSGNTDAISLDEIEEIEPDEEPAPELELAGPPSGGVGKAKGPSVLLEKPIEDSDAETHYDLGLAYKEMGLYDEAIKAFEKVSRAPGREVQCRLMIGLCNREHDNHSAAVHQFKIGLHATTVTERERQTLFYEIGVTYEAMGDTSEALYYLEMVIKRDPGFLDAAARVNQLRAGGAQRRPEDTGEQHDGI
jgi:tetratricopeptide (TPR) repeat protein